MIEIVLSGKYYLKRESSTPVEAKMKNVHRFPGTRRLPVSQLLWEEEKEQRREESEKRHARMAALFVEDRLAFERERKRLLDEFFSSVEDDDMRRRLRALQSSYDDKMKHAGSAHNRFVLAQTFFWDNFHKNWQPGIQKINSLLQNLVGKNGTSNDADS